MDTKVGCRSSLCCSTSYKNKRFDQNARNGGQCPANAAGHSDEHTYYQTNNSTAGISAGNLGSDDSEHPFHQHNKPTSHSEHTAFRSNNSTIPADRFATDISELSDHRRGTAGYVVEGPRELPAEFGLGKRYRKFQ